MQGSISPCTLSTPLSGSNEDSSSEDEELDTDSRAWEEGVFPHNNVQSCTYNA